MAPRRRITFSDTHSEQSLDPFLPKSVPEDNAPKCQMYISQVFSQPLTDNVDPRPIHNCLDAEAMEWYDTVGEAARVGPAPSVEIRTSELEPSFKDTAGKTSVDSSEQHNNQTLQHQHSTSLGQSPHRHLRNALLPYQRDSSKRRWITITTPCATCVTCQSSSTLSLQHQAVRGYHFVDFWSISRPRDPIQCLQILDLRAT